MANLMTAPDDGLREALDAAEALIAQMRAPGTVSNAPDDPYATALIRWTNARAALRSTPATTATDDYNPLCRWCMDRKHRDARRSTPAAPSCKHPDIEMVRGGARCLSCGVVEATPAAPLDLMDSQTQALLNALVDRNIYSPADLATALTPAAPQPDPAVHEAVERMREPLFAIGKVLADHYDTRRATLTQPQPDAGLREAAQAVVDDWFGTYDPEVRIPSAAENIEALRAALQPDTARWYGVLEQVHLAQIVHEALGYTDDYHGEPNCGIVAERIAAALRSTPAAPLMRRLDGSEWTADAFLAAAPQPDTALTVERLAEAMHREWPGVTKVCHPPETCRHRARAANLLRALRQVGWTDTALTVERLGEIVEHVREHAAESYSPSEMTYFVSPALDGLAAAILRALGEGVES